VKIASWVMFVFFCLSALLQINDPDPVIWLSLYATCAAISLGSGLGRPLRRTTIAALAVYVSGIITLAPALGDTTLDSFARFAMKNEREERVREFWGLIICAVWCAVLLWRARIRDHQAAETGSGP
jgi:nitrate/nitrite transporter NarK